MERWNGHWIMTGEEVRCRYRTAARTASGIGTMIGEGIHEGAAQHSLQHDAMRELVAPERPNNQWKVRGANWHTGSHGLSGNYFWY